MKIKVLGSGCANCKKLLHMVEVAVKDLGIEAEIAYVTDIIEISKSGIMRTPGLIIDKKIVVSGRVPKMSELVELLKDDKNL